MMELREDVNPTGWLVTGDSEESTCQVNVGTDDQPKSCGLKLKKVNDWTWKCKNCGEMH